MATVVARFLRTIPYLTVGCPTAIHSLYGCAEYSSPPLLLNRKPCLVLTEDCGFNSSYIITYSISSGVLPLSLSFLNSDLYLFYTVLNCSVCISNYSL